MDMSMMSKLTVCLLMAVTCSTVLAENEFAENESSRNHQQRISIHSDDSASFISEGRRGALWDDGLQISSSGNRKDKKINDRNNDDDDEKKTLSQQVKEGKYGLIQNEIFSASPKRPGVVSYASNSDMPKDTVKNFGGLDEDEIWLAENHVLVLRGGKLPERDSQNSIGEEKWSPIDDYQAPRRQVKIPSRPKVPPPFPVQLIDGGPIKILGSNEYNDSNNAINVTFSKGFLPGEGPFFPLFANNSSPFMPALSFIPVNSTKGTFQFKPIIIPDKQSKLKPHSKEEKLPMGPFYPALPPGAVIVPPPSNRSDYDDEEDQSIYYPPPYSFVYDVKNDSTVVPPGPLVPGIILPPPPDFFSPLEDEKKPSNVKDKYKNTGSTINTSRLPSSINNLSRKANTKLYKGDSTTITSSPLTTTQKPKVTTPRSSISRYSPKTSLRKLVNNTVFVPKTVFVEVTTPTPPSIKSHTYDAGTIVSNQVSEVSTKKNGWTSVVSSKNVPLLATFYATTTPSPSKEQQIETTPSSGRQTTRLPDQTSYFFYGEPNNEASDSPNSNDDAKLFFAPTTTTESPSNFYKLTEFSQKEENPYYNRVEEPQTPHRETTIKLLESLVEDPRVYEYTESVSKSRAPVQTNPGSSLYVSTISTDRARNSYLTMTPEPPIYYQDPQVGVKFDYEQQKGKSKPIYQYSFEAADYNKERKTTKKKKQQNERGITYQIQEGEIVPTVHQNSYNTPRLPYKSHRPVEYFSATTIRSPIDVSTTLEPHRVYITKQDEQLLDDVTKEYFTMFGKKLTGKRVQSTTPIYKVNSVTERPKYSSNAYVSNEYDRARYKVPKVKVHYGGLSSISRPHFSLQGDTLVNFKHPLRPINPDSEFITVVSPEHSRTGKLISQPIVQEDFRVRQVLQSDNQVRDYGSQRVLHQTQQQNQNDFIPMEGPRSLGQNSVYSTRPVSLANDEAVNYQNPRPPTNPDAEYIGPPSGPTINRYRNKANSYFAYNLPGDGGHFYFLTPQAIPQRQSNTGSYLYSNPRVSRFIRRRRGPN